MKELKNRKQRMEYIQNSDNWTLIDSTGLIRQYRLDYGKHEFLRIECYELDRFYHGKPRYTWECQFEIVYDGGGSYMVHRSNSDIADIMGRKE